MIDESIEKFKLNIENENYAKIFISLKQFFTKYSAAEEIDASISQFLELFDQNFDILIESEHSKKTQMRQIIAESLEKTFNIDSFNLEIQKSDFLKERIVELVKTQINFFFFIFKSKNTKNQELIQRILLKLFDRFPEKAENLFSDIFEYFCNNPNEIDYVLPLIDKILDQSPKIVLSKFFSWIDLFINQELQINGPNIILIKEIFHLLKIYCEIYPDYCSVYLNQIIIIFLFTIDHSILEDNIINDFAFIVYFYAKHGEYLIANYIFDLYQLGFNLKKEPQRLIYLSIREIYENYPEEISNKIIENNNEELFSTKLLIFLSNIDDRQVLDVLIDLFLMINIEISKIKFKNKISISNSDQEHIKLEFYDLIKNYYQILKNLNNYIKNYVYILFKSISEIDQKINEYFESNITSSAITLPNFSQKYLLDEKLSEEIDNKKIKEIFESFLIDLYEFILSLKNQIN